MMISLLIPWFYRAFGRFVLEIRRQYYCTAFYRLEEWVYIVAQFHLKSSQFY